MFDDQGTEQRGAWVFDIRRQCQTPACRVARSQKKAPCPNKRPARERHLRVAVPEDERPFGAALKPAGVSSWGSTLPPDDSKQGPRSVGMISGIQPVVFSTISCRRRKTAGKGRNLTYLQSLQPHRLTGRLQPHPQSCIHPTFCFPSISVPDSVFLPLSFTSLTLLCPWLLPTPPYNPSILNPERMVSAKTLTSMVFIITVCWDSLQAFSAFLMLSGVHSTLFMAITPSMELHGWGQEQGQKAV